MDEKISTYSFVVFSTVIGNLEMSGSDSATSTGSRSICPFTGSAVAGAMSAYNLPNSLPAFSVVTCVLDFPKFDVNVIPA
ncbi:hypothetical protein D3C76_1594620 [compost metagenome]